MVDVRTKTCSRHGHPEFRVNYDPAIVSIDNDVKWFVSWLEESVAQGTRFSAGQTCQVGWVVTEIRLREDGDLSVWEPDMRHMPVVWSESVSHTLTDLRTQKDVVESVLDGEEIAFPSMRESAIICTRLARGEDFMMERTPPSGMASGWFFGCWGKNHDHNDPAELSCVSLYEAAVLHASQIVPYLALPSGLLILVRNGAPILYRDGVLLAFRAGGYLEMRSARR